VVEALATDIVVTELGALGCALYLHFLWRRKQHQSGIGASLFLFGVVTVLLAVRGPFWYFASPFLGRLTFAAATLLPLAITLFCEQLLRRHHPFWLKVLALSVTVVFFVANLGGAFFTEKLLLGAFLVSFLIVTAANAYFLLSARPDDLSVSELRIARAGVVVAVLSLPLIASDFRDDFSLMPVRLGALGALLFVSVLLNVSSAPNAVWKLLGRLFLALVAACALSGAFALASAAAGDDLLRRTLSGVPVSFAWMLLTAIVVRLSSLFAQNSDNAFLHWLLLARMDSAAGFLHSLRHLPQTSEHVVLEREALAGYSLDTLFELERRREPIDIAGVRAQRARGVGVDAAEQLIDMLERHGMTHALLISKAPPLIVLVRFPQGIHSSIGSLRAAVIQRIARKLPKEPLN
jgi:hypothetical protein